MWIVSGYLAEARRRLDRVVDIAGDQDNRDVGRCLVALSQVADEQGDPERARDVAAEAAAMFRRLGDKGELSWALRFLGLARSHLGESQNARSTLEEAATLAAEAGDSNRLARILSELSAFEASEGKLERSLELDTAALDSLQEQGNERVALYVRHNMACTLREMGRVDDAQQQMRDQIPQHLRVADRLMLVVVAEDYGAVLAELGNHPGAARLLGAADAMRQRIGNPRAATQENEIREAFAKARAALDADTWENHYQAGHNTTVEDALNEAHAATCG
jgi:tetratricopeptide (TPR) repeat protein